MMDVIELAGVGTLTPTLGSAMSLNSKHGTLMALARKLEDCDMAAAVDVAAAGTGLPREKAAEAVFAAGLFHCIAPLTRFVLLLGNGGKFPTEAEPEGDTDAPLAASG